MFTIWAFNESINSNSELINESFPIAILAWEMPKIFIETVLTQSFFPTIFLKYVHPERCSRVMKVIIRFVPPFAFLTPYVCFKEFPDDFLDYFDYFHFFLLYPL